MRVLRNYQEQNNTKKLIWKTSENNQHFDQHWQSSVKITDETIWISIKMIMNSIMNQSVLQWFYKFRYNQQTEVNSAKIRECVQSKKTLLKKRKNTSIQRDTEML